MFDPANVCIVVDDVTPEYLLIQISKDFTDPPGVGGVFPPKLIDFLQVDTDENTVPQIVIENSLFQNDVQRIDVVPPLTPYEVGLCAHLRKINSPVVRAFWRAAK